MQSLLSWIAEYNDGTIVTQDDVDSTELIDRSKLAKFTLSDDSGRQVFSAFFDQNRKLIFRRRTFMDANGNIKEIVYLVGWHQNVKGVSIKSICYVYSDGRVEFDDSRSDLELVACEQFDDGEA